MKRVLALVLALVSAVGCVGAQKQFTLTVDPPDAQIMVVTRTDEPGVSYRSPAKISVPIPEDPSMAAQSRVVISRENYKTIVLQPGSVQGDNIRIKLAKAVQYRLKYSLLTPSRSDELVFKDKILAVRIVPRERDIDVRIENLSQKPLTIAWEKADFSDFMRRRHRIFLARTKWERRHDKIPPQIIPAGGSLQESIMPVNAIEYSAKEKRYVAKPLFVLDDDSALALKGKTINLFLPVEQDGGLIPDYSFKIRIENVIKE